MPRPHSARIPSPLLAAAGCAALLASVPLIYLAVRITDAGADGLLAVLSRPRIPLLLANTVALAAAVTVSATVLGVLSAWVLARVHLPARRLLGALVVLPLAVPSYLAAFGWLAAFPHIHGFWPAWLVLTVVTTPYVVLPVTATLRGASGAHTDVARTLGCTPMGAFRRVTWPAIRGSAFAGALLVCLYVLADFGGVALFRYPVLTTAVHQAYGATFDRNYAAVLAGILVLVALLVYLGERRLRPSRQFSVDREDSRVPLRIGGWTPWAVAVLLLPVAGAVGVPVVSLLNRLRAAESVAVLDLPGLAEATVNTVLLSGAGALIAVLLALPIATLAARYRGRIARVLEAVASLPLAVPGIVIGLGLVFFSLGVVPVLYQTAAMLAFAYGVLFLPKAIGTVRASIERVPTDLEDVAATLGHGRLRRWWEVTARLARPGVVVSVLFITVTAMKELPATLLLRPTGMETLAVRVWAKTDISAYGAAVPYALALLVVAAVPALLLAPRGDRSDMETIR
ncbi:MULTISPECIES: ABC transporter permease [unclassified Nocardiopsis]|uniref:ABC transporter permease n=1 Tax=Nocardiopsis TaxID=2013 RepID=UPI00387B97A6